MGCNLSATLSELGKLQPQQEEWSRCPKLHHHPKFLAISRLVLQLNKGKHTLSVAIQHEYHTIILEK
jgi:hypothetical protein